MVLTEATDISYNRSVMKKGLHPNNYRSVVFQDTSSDFKFLTKSTASTDETIKWEDGQEYPLVKVHISSASHPFFTGEEKIVDVEGRVDKFKARTEAAKKAREAAATRSGSNKTQRKERSESQKLGEKKTVQKATDKTEK